MTPFLLEGQHREDLDRRGFLQKTSLASLGLMLSGRDPLRVDATAAQPSGGAAGIATNRVADLASGGHPIKLFCCDLNWVRLDHPVRGTPPSAPQDWAFVNPQEYFDWHREFGGNVMFCQAYTFGGYAFYPTKLGPVAPGPGANLFPELFKLSRKAHLPFHSYFCVGADLIMSNMRNAWVVPTRAITAGGASWRRRLLGPICFARGWRNFFASTRWSGSCSIGLSMGTSNPTICPCSRHGS